MIKESINKAFRKISTKWDRRAGHNLQARQMVVSIIVVSVKEKK
jgi:hypothetical protein